MTGGTVQRRELRRSTRIGTMVMRYHTWPTIQQQTVADHTMNVLRIWCELFGPPQPHVTHYLVYHDVGESGAGDPPFPSKQLWPELKAAHDRAEADTLCSMGISMDGLFDGGEEAQAKVCDLLEMWEFGLTEWMLGSRYADAVVVDTLRAALQRAPITVVPSIVRWCRVTQRQLCGGMLHEPTEAILAGGWMEAE